MVSLISCSFVTVIFFPKEKNSIKVSTLGMGEILKLSTELLL